MKIKGIKDSLEKGDRVYWRNTDYEVIKDSKGQYLVMCHLNNDCIGLAWRNETTLNGDEKEFFAMDDWRE